MRTLVVDAYDSFVHIVAQYLTRAGAGPTVVRSGDLDEARVEAFGPDAIVLGPGPGHPVDSGHVELLRAFAGRVPMLGICLGHQALGVAHGAEVRPAGHLMHGKTSRIHHDGRGVFAGLPNPFEATRYHSLVVVEETVPPCLEVTAVAEDDGYVMGLRHRSLPVETVQFHPESVCTEDGFRLLANFADRARALAGAATGR
jgi:anthranilate synthase component 2